jgi:IS1 family transposase
VDWIAIDGLTKEIVGVYIGSRDELGAKGLWNSCATCSRVNVLARYTDFWQAYSTSFPTKRHKTITKNSSLTNYIAILNHL